MLAQSPRTLGDRPTGLGRWRSGFVPQPDPNRGRSPKKLSNSTQLLQIFNKN
ncbi:hypothetical protein JJD41_05710 [Oxynema sp. CENA135]|nr:hypothetical protein [Oxynema sp. CENA135]